MKKLLLALVLVFACGVAVAQQGVDIQGIEVAPDDEGAFCNPVYWPLVYWAFDDNNVYRCVGGLWKQIAPSAASDRIGWYILSDDMNDADELATQIGAQTTGTGDFVRQDSPVVDTGDLQLTTTMRVGSTEGVMAWDGVNDQLDITDGTADVQFLPIQQWDTADEFAGVMPEVSGTGDFLRQTDATITTPNLFLEASSCGADEGRMCWDGVNERINVGGGIGPGVQEFYPDAHTVDTNTDAASKCGTNKVLNGQDGCANYFEHDAGVSTGYIPRSDGSGDWTSSADMVFASDRLTVDGDVTFKDGGLPEIDFAHFATESKIEGTYGMSFVVAGDEYMEFNTISATTIMHNGLNGICSGAPCTYNGTFNHSAGVAGFQGEFKFGIFGTLANDATPDVDEYTVYKTGGTTTITDYDAGVTGKWLTVLADHAITITHGASTINLNSSTDFVMSAGDTLSLLLRADGAWYEVGRMEL